MTHEQRIGFATVVGLSRVFPEVPKNDTDWKYCHIRPHFQSRMGHLKIEGSTIARWHSARMQLTYIYHVYLQHGSSRAKWWLLPCCWFRLRWFWYLPLSSCTCVQWWTTSTTRSSLCSLQDLWSFCAVSKCTLTGFPKFYIIIIINWWNYQKLKSSLQTMFLNSYFSKNVTWAGAEFFRMY